MVSEDDIGSHQRPRLGIGDRAREVQRRDDSDGPAALVGGDDQVRRLVLRHDLRRTLDRVLRRDGDHLGRRDLGGGALVERLADGARQVEVGDQTPRRGALRRDR